MATATGKFASEKLVLKLSECKPHPKNYNEHPEDQRKHIAESLKQFGFYRPLILAQDNTILAGHGLYQTAKDMKLEEVPVIRYKMKSDSKAALKILAGDNHIRQLSMSDDRLLAEILRDVVGEDPMNLVGTGFDRDMLSALVFTTRHADEIASKDDADKWVGLPSFENVPSPMKLIVQFRNAKDREKFCKQNELELSSKTRETWSTWWPKKEKDDTAGVKFQ